MLGREAKNIDGCGGRTCRRGIRVRAGAFGEQVFYFLDVKMPGALPLFVPAFVLMDPLVRENSSPTVILAG